MLYSHCKLRVPLDTPAQNCVVLVRKTEVEGKELRRTGSYIHNLLSRPHSPFLIPCAPPAHSTSDHQSPLPKTELSKPPTHKRPNLFRRTRPTTTCGTASPRGPTLPSLVPGAPCASFLRARRRVGPHPYLALELNRALPLHLSAAFLPRAPTHAAPVAQHRWRRRGSAQVHRASSPAETRSKTAKGRTSLGKTSLLPDLRPDLSRG